MSSRTGLTAESGAVQGGVAVEAALDEWRRKAAHIMLVACAVAYLPGLLLLFITHDPPFGWPVVVCAVIAYVTIAAGALLRRVDYRIKAWIALCAAYPFAILGTIALPQGPFVRVLPLCLAIPALVVIGARAGRVATVVGAVITLFVPVLHIILPGLAGTLVVRHGREMDSLGMVLTQGAVMVGALVSIMVLLERYHVFLLRSLASERLAASRLEEEAAERTAAHKALQHEMEERRRLEREIARVGDEERRRLGQDVHDGVCQQLTGALLRCQALERRLERGGDVGSEDVSSLSMLLEEAIDEAHAVAKGLCPLEPSPASLSPALRVLAKRAQETTGVQCRFTATGDVSVPDPEVAQHLYRIAQEALSNASRHAQASRIDVELQRRDDELLLRVEDNGAGLPNELPSGGMGLRTMAYRAQMLEGEISVEPGPNGGTCVVCRVPIG